MSEELRVKFIIGGETKEVTFERGESLLDCAIRNDLNPPYSCMEGVCTACAAVLQEGEVDHSDDTILDQEEIDRGRILTCQAIPKRDCKKLTVNYDAD